VPMTRGERLFDLIWARQRILNNITGLNSHLPQIEQELRAIATIVFGRTLQLDELHELFLHLHSTSSLQAAGFPDGAAPLGNLPPQLILLRDWLSDQAVYNRSAEIHCVSTSNDAPLLRGIQDWLRAQIGGTGIVIEINPTSNLLVGNLSDITHHPLWRLSSPDPQKRGNSLRICLGSDDPVTFATNLPEEYQLLADSITRAGHSAQDADRWIEEAREAGITSRFTISTPGEVSFALKVPPIPSSPMIP